MNKLKQLTEAIIAVVPEIKELKMGCRIENVAWHKTEKDKKDGVIDWCETGLYKKSGTVVKDLRGDFLDMWVDCGDQLEFSIEPNDIVSMDIIGRDITLADVLRAFIAGDEVLKQYPQSVVLSCEEAKTIIGMWNLEKNALHLQEQPTIDFLHNIIV